MPFVGSSSVTKPVFGSFISLAVTGLIVIVLFVASVVNTSLLADTTFNVWLSNNTSALDLPPTTGAALATVSPAIRKFTERSCATFTASVSSVPAARCVI